MELIILIPIGVGGYLLMCGICCLIGSMKGEDDET